MDKLSNYMSQIEELRNLDNCSELRSGKNSLNDIVDEVERNIECIFSGCSSNLCSLQSEDLNNFLDHLKKELREVEDENADVENEIDELTARCVDDYDKLESELQKLRSLLELNDSQSPGEAEGDMQIDASFPADDLAHFSTVDDSKFKMLELSHQIEKNKGALKSLQDLDSMFKRFEAVEKIEDVFTGLRVIEIEGNSIRLSLNTHIPYLESVLHQQDIESLNEPLELNHEMIIETMDGTMELKSVEIFPNDVYIGEIIDAAKSFRQLYPTFSVIETRSSLELFVRRVQDRIALCSVRRFVVKKANKSRRSLEYIDREDVIVAHMVGGIDALIKLPQGWPLSDLAMELLSLKSTSQYSKDISLSFLCKIMEMANSLSKHIRHSIARFTDSIEEILMQQMSAELHPIGITAR